MSQKKPKSEKDRRQQTFKRRLVDDRLIYLINWLGQDWLESDGTHPLQILWREPTKLAEIELLNISESIKIQQEIVGTTWFEKERKKTKNQSQAFGPIHEILTAAQFHAPARKQVSTLCSANQKGYDVDLHLSNDRSIRLSCKSLASHSQFRKFKARCSNVSGILEEFADNNGKLNYQIIFQAKRGEKIASQTVDSFQTALRKNKKEILLNLKHHNYHELESKQWRARILTLEDVLDGRKLSPHYSSFKFFAFQDRERNELEKSWQALDKARAELKEHCNDIDLKTINAVTLKIPTTLHLATAAKDVHEQFNRETYSHISAAILIRYLIHHHGSKHVSFTVEYSLVQNQQASVKWNDFFNSGETLHGTLPMGNVAQEISIPRLVIPTSNSKDMVIQLVDQYYFQKGRVIFHGKIEETELHFPSYPNAEVGYALESNDPNESNHALIMLKHVSRSEPLLL